MAPTSTIHRGEADAIVGRIEEARGWSTHASNGWSICSVGGPFRNDAPAWICVMCEPEHLAPGETIETQIERFAAWLAGLGWAMRRESMMHPAHFRLVPGPVSATPEPCPGCALLRSALDAERAMRADAEARAEQAIEAARTDATAREDARWRGPYLARVDELTTARAKVNDLTAKLADAQAVAEMRADIATKERREVERLGAELEKERAAFIGANRAWSAAVSTQEKADTERDEAKASAKRWALLAERNGEDAMAHAAKASRLQGELNEANARIFELEAQARLAENTALEKSE